jgi:serine/threonine protein kinase
MIQNMAYSFPADCFSFGVMLHEFLRLELPFQGSSTADLVRSILQDEPPSIPSHYSDDLKAITYALLAKDPEKRLGFAGMLLHPLLQNKTSQFPSAYRPKALEERMRRAHMRHLHSQIDMLQNSKKSSTTSTATLLEGTPYEYLVQERKKQPDSARSSISEARRKSSVKSPTGIQNAALAETVLRESVAEKENVPEKDNTEATPLAEEPGLVPRESAAGQLEQLKEQYGHGEIDDDCEGERIGAQEAMKAEVRLSVADPNPDTLPPISGSSKGNSAEASEATKDSTVGKLPEINS